MVNTLELADKLTNLVEQMYLAHKIHDDAKFDALHKEAVQIGATLVEALDN